MRTRLGVITVFAALAASAFGVSPGAAQSPQSYPYCRFDTSLGATSCYYTSREQCGSLCIPNPAYAGPSSTAMASVRNGRNRRARH